MKIGLLTVSDSCYKQPELDKSGPTLKECLQDYLEFSGSTFIVDIVPDELDAIKEWMLRHVSLVDVILTTGGTGFSSRDVTPEATKSVIERQCPGIVVALLKVGLDKTPLAALSRLEAGICQHCLIINLPGSPKACRESIPVLASILPHAISVLNEDKKQVKHTHTSMQDDQK